MERSDIMNTMDNSKTPEEISARMAEMQAEILFWQVQWHKLAAAFKKFSRDNIDGYDFLNESNDQSGMVYER